MAPMTAVSLAVSTALRAAFSVAVAVSDPTLFWLASRLLTASESVEVRLRAVTDSTAVPTSPSARSRSANASSTPVALLVAVAALTVAASAAS